MVSQTSRPAGQRGSNSRRFMLTHPSFPVLFPDQSALIQAPKPQTLYELVKQGTWSYFLAPSALYSCQRQLMRLPLILLDDQ
jgi:hypothetical protein